MKNLFLVLFVLFFSTFVWARGGKSTQRCIKRIESSCRVSILSGHKQNIQSCHEVVPGLEIVELKNEKFSLVNSKTCAGQQYDMDFVGVNDIKPIHSHLFLLSDNGQAFFMDDANDFYEILDSQGRSHSDIFEINAGKGNSVELVLDSGKKLSLSRANLISKAYKGQLKKLRRYELKEFIQLFK